MTTPAQLANSEYCRRYYRLNAETLRAKKRGPARAYKQRVLLQQAIEAARAELSKLFNVARSDQFRSIEPCV